MSVPTLTNQEFYQLLDDNNIYWDRRDAAHIVVALNGYHVYGQQYEAVVNTALDADHKIVGTEYDRHSGKTFYLMLHK